jgi:S-methylmethionine-dependent homocysteine/selenocysteine methylase
MVGGCCGTTPKHIAALRPVVDRWNAGRGNRYP